MGDKPASNPVTSTIRTTVIAVIAAAALLLTATPAVADDQHTVHRGDTLTAIARTHCGNSGAWRGVAAANPQVRNPHLIYPGQVLTVPCTAASPVVRPATTTASRGTTRATSGVQAVLDYARAQVGKPYRWGAAGPNAYDCSGLVVAAYARIGVQLPHQSGALLSRGRQVSRAQLQPGDLVWPHYGHVMIYAGGGNVIEAANPAVDVVHRKMYAFWTARRVL